MMLENEVEISFSETNEQKTQTKQRKQDKKVQNSEKENNIPVKVLKQSISNQQRDRMMSKIQKEIQAKDDQLYQLNKNYRKIQQQLTKTQSTLQKLTSQNQSLKLKMKQLAKESQKSKAIQKENQSKKHNQVQLLQLKRLQQQNVQLHKKITQLQKQHKINIRRMLTQSEQLKKSLQSKIQVKCKQQQKIEELFEKKKQDFNGMLEQRDRQLKMLSQAKIAKEKHIRQLNEFLDEAKNTMKCLQEKLIHFEQKYKSQSQVWMKNNQQLKTNLLRFEQQTNQQKQSLKNNLLSFHQDFKTYSKDPANLQLCQILNSIKRWVSAQYQKKDREMARLSKENQVIDKIKEAEKQLNYTVTAQKQELKKLNSLLVQSKSKVEILEQQLKFIKNKEKNSTNFAEVIRQHLKQNKSKPKNEQNCSEKKEKECKVKYKVDFKNTTVSEKQETSKLKIKNPTIARNQLVISKNQELNLIKNKKTQNQKYTSHFIGSDKSNPKSQNWNTRSHSVKGNFQHQIDRNSNQYQNVLCWLTNKKQSLIYLMYQGQNDNGNKSSSGQPANKAQQATNIKKRSNSMSELVRLRCESNIGSQ